jgi:hypothetical protein
MLQSLCVVEVFKAYGAQVGWLEGIELIAFKYPSGSESAPIVVAHYPAVFATCPMYLALLG